MPLSDGYGFLMGKITDYYRDPPDNFGRYYHGNLIVNASGGSYHCAIDVDSQHSDTGVEWRTVQSRADEVQALVALGSGFHTLASNGSSGAIDYIRSPMFAARLGCLAVIYLLLGKSFQIKMAWKRGNSVEALSDLEPLVQITRAANLNVLVFGEPFTSGLGVHNIHQNQGDPVSTQWAAENGIWQDGCTILQQSEDVYTAFLNKFTTQSYLTDDLGHPA